MGEKKLSHKVVELDAKKAKALIGFRTDLKEGEKGISFVDENGVKAKFVLDNNRANRPFEIGMAKRYSELMLRGQFAGQWGHPSQTPNGETIVVDWDGQLTNGAHRLVALIMAQAKREQMEKFGYTDDIEDLEIPEKITLPVLLVEGVDPQAADTTDNGKPRSLGDVLFRRHTFQNGKEIPESVRAMLSRELAVAIRLVWLRLRGEVVAGGGKLLFPDALEFLERHPLLPEALLHVYNEDGGSGSEGSKIRGYISLGYAAALLYLAAWSNTLRQGLEDGSTNLTKRPKLWDKAEEFWTLFSQLSSRGIGADKAPAIAALNVTLEKNAKSEQKFSRDALCVLVTRAWLSWIGAEDADPKWNSTRGLGSNLYRKVDDQEVLSMVRFGGFDVDREVLEENDWSPSDPGSKLSRKSFSAFKVGDLLWVDQPDVDPWFGEVVAFSDDGQQVGMIEKFLEDAYYKGESYWAKTEWLKVDRPKRDDEEEVVEKKTRKPRTKKTEEVSEVEKVEKAAKGPPKKKGPPVMAG